VPLDVFSGRMMLQAYTEFVRSRSQKDFQHGFTPTWIPDYLKDFQANLVEWAILKGRAGLFEGCGLGKTIQELVFAQNVIEHTNKPVLLVSPLGVTAQTVDEAHKFGIECERSKTGKYTHKLVVTNFESLNKFDPSDFAGIVTDELQGIKNSDAKRTKELTDFARNIEFRLGASATPAPNDYIELGTSSEYLGELGFSDMITKFFRQAKNTNKQRGWHIAKYRLMGHAQQDFWRWVCSWARAIRKPSDLGDYDDSEYILPPLTIQQHIIEARTKKPGHLFDVPAVTLREQKEERRRTINERCEAAAALVNNTGKSAICWCHLNPEGDLLAKLIPDAVQVSGRNSDDEKEEAFTNFVNGKIRVIVTKDSLGALGLNFQHCAHQVTFMTHSFELDYQKMRRSWRFGQKNPVHVDRVMTEGEAPVAANLQRKFEQAEVMMDSLVKSVNDQLRIERDQEYTKQMDVPAFLRS
jgi:superfamily II DNA or RNA helicase